MNFLIISAMVLVVSYNLASAGKIYSTNENDLNDHWETFKKTHSKSYQDASHESKKKQTFVDNVKKMNAHNQRHNDGKETYHMAVNHFSDLTPEEFMDYVKKGLPSDHVESDQKRSLSDSVSVGASAIPASIDWRALGKVNPQVKDQGACGSCSTFSAVAALESAYAITNNVLPNLSEQNLVDCTYPPPRDMCATGGWYWDEWNYVIKNGGIGTELSYPYTSGSKEAWSGSCLYKQTGSFNPQLVAFGSTPAGNETALTQAIATVGPVSVAFYVTSNLGHYAGGVYTDTVQTCPNSINHAVALVGYGTDNATGLDYYIMRNSWGAGWGNGGYINFARNHNNMCNIATYARYPIVNKV